MSVLFRFLVSYLKSRWKPYALLVGLGGLVWVVEVLFLFQAKKTLSAGLWSASNQELFFASLGFLGVLFLLHEGIRLSHDYHRDLWSRRFAEYFQNKITGRLMRAKYSKFARTSQGDWLHRILYDVTQISNVLSFCLSASFRDPMRVLFFGGVVLVINPVVGIIFTGVMALGWFGITFFQKRINRLYRQLIQEEEKQLQLMKNILRYFPLLKVENLIEKYYGVWKRINRSMTGFFRDSNRVYIFQQAVLVGILVLVVGFLAAAYRAKWGPFPDTAGSMVYLMGSVFLCFQGIRNIVSNWSTLREEWVRFPSLLEMLQYEAEGEEAHDGEPLKDVIGRVTLSGISFGYLPGVKVLDRLEWSFHKGETVLLKGRNGSGKSTLAALLMKLLEPLEGKIFINDIPLNRIHSGSLRRRAGIVLQEPMILEGTLEENLLWNVPKKLTKEALLETLRLFGLSHLGVDEADLLSLRLGEGKRELSFGEKQRLALARIYLREPDLLILDEATSALEPESETELLEKVIEARRDKITVIISHRLEEILSVNQVATLSNGKISVETFKEAAR